jgi:hypothetical protein
VQTLSDGPHLLDLLREAGDEAVTLEELAVAGVPDVAQALLELELAGLEVQRVYEHTSGSLCVRLAPERAPDIDALAGELLEPPTFEFTAVPGSRPRPAAAAPPPAPEPAPAPAAPVPDAVASHAQRNLVMAALAALVVLLLARRG